MNNTAIPFLDLVTPHVELEQELVEVLRRSLRTAGFVGGAMVENFEKDFAAFCEAEHCVAVNSGTDALRFALIAAGVKAGDVALTVPNTFIATSEAISQAGALPEFVDVDEQTSNLSAARLEEYLTGGCQLDAEGRLISRRSGRPVTAVVPVHLYGQMAEMDAILKLARQYGLVVIEDACQAHGAEYYSQERKRWCKAGSMGDAAAFSFYPGKNLGACGEGGAITTNHARIASVSRMLRDHGQAKKYYHDMEGYNGRLDSIQAGFLHVKLPYMTKWNAQRREHAATYRTLLAGNARVVVPSEPEWSRSVYHLFVIRSSERDSMIQSLNAAGIGTGIHYPIPLHMQNAYRCMKYEQGSFPVTERLATQIVSLPMFPQLRPEQVERVAEQVCRITEDMGK